MPIDPSRLVRKNDPDSSRMAIDIESLGTVFEKCAEAVRRAGVKGASTFDIGPVIGKETEVQNFSSIVTQLRTQGVAQLVPYYRINARSKRKVQIVLSCEYSIDQFEPQPGDVYDPTIITKAESRETRKVQVAAENERRGGAFEVMASICYCLKTGNASTATRLLRGLEAGGVDPAEFISEEDRRMLDAQADENPGVEAERVQALRR